MMNDRELLDQAKGKVLSGEIGVLLPEDGRAMSLTEFLSEEQYDIIRNAVIACIDSDLECARNFLRCANAVNEGMKLGVMAENAIKEGKASEEPEAAEGIAEGLKHIIPAIAEMAARAAKIAKETAEHIKTMPEEDFNRFMESPELDERTKALARKIRRTE